MLNEKKNIYPKKIFYQIKVEGVVDESWTDWLGCMHLKSYQNERGQSVTRMCTELLDQASLRGLLNRLWDLNLVLLSVRQVDSVNNLDSEKGGFK